MFSVDQSDLRQLTVDLGKLSKRALPFATRNTLNSAAFKTRERALENISSQMVERNKFTRQSVRVDRTKTLNMSAQEAIIGSVADYLEKQEFGYTKNKKGSEGVPIASTYASGEGEGARPRQRLPRRPNKLSNISLLRSKRAKTKAQRSLLAVREAVKAGRKYVFLELRKSTGIFRIVGGKRNPKLKMVWDLSRPSVVIPANPWLMPATNDVIELVPEIHKKSLEFQLNRLKSFR